MQCIDVIRTMSNCMFLELSTNSQKSGLNLCDDLKASEDSKYVRTNPKEIAVT